MTNLPNLIKKISRVILIAVIPVFILSGCMEILFDGARLSKKKAEIQTWLYLAKDGDVEAQYKVGSLYCCGERPYYNNIEALKWWCTAAKKGQRDAMFEIGKIYDETTNYKGSIVPKDPVLSYTYFSLALLNDHTASSDYIARIKSKLSEEELKEAETLIKRFPRIWCENPR